MLHFVKTLTIAEFKASLNIEAIEIVRTKANKLAFRAGATIGAVTTEDYDNAVVSLVTGDDDEFWMIHKRADFGTVVATL